MKKTFIQIFKKPKNIITLIVLSFMNFIFLRIIPVFTILREFNKIPNISFVRKWEVFYEYTIQAFSDLILLEQLFIIFFSILISINIVLFIVFAQRQRKVLRGKTLWGSMVGMFLGIFGVGCVSCGFLVIAPLLTLLGLGAYIQFFTQYAILISFIGMGIIIVSIIFLLRKISQPRVCKI